MGRDTASDVFRNAQTGSEGLGVVQGRSGGSGAHSELFVWGVDPSTKRLAIGFSGEDRTVAASVTFDKGPITGTRLEDIRLRTRSFVAAYAELYPPEFVWIEQPFASKIHVEPSLYYAVGVIYEALSSALRFVADFPVEVRMMHLSTWKKLSVGNGAAKKPDVLRWANRNGYPGEQQDEADAFCIAIAGRKLLEPAPEQLSLAG